MEGICEIGTIDCVNFYPKKEEAFDVYPLQYLEHEIKENNLELKLKNKKIIFDLK